MRLGAALVGAALLGASALMLDPYGIYVWERHVPRMLAGALVGAGLGAAIAPFLASARWTGWLVLLVGVAAAHPAFIVLFFLLAVSPTTLVVVAVIALSVAGATWGLLRRMPPSLLTGLAVAILLASPLHARFLRAPASRDCTELLAAPGVTALSTWPHTGLLAGSVLYDVAADEDAGLAFSFHTNLPTGGCSAIAAWPLDGSAPTVVEVPPADNGCFGQGRLMLGEPGTLWLALDSYDSAVIPELTAWRYGDGALTLLSRRPLGATEPADVRLLGPQVLVLSYSERFAEQEGVILGSIPLDGGKPTIVNLDPEGWLTEYLAPDPAGGTVFVTDIAGWLYEVDPEALAVRRKVRLGASTLGAVVDGDRLWLAAPYRRQVLEVDRQTLQVRGAMPAGAATRQVALDDRRRRLAATGYGDGVLTLHDLRSRTRTHAIPLGTPLRGLVALPRSGRFLAGGGCGPALIDPEAL